MKLTDKQIEMFKRKFEKGYTLIELCNDLQLNANHIGKWEEGNFTELLEEGGYLEYLGNVEKIHIYNENEEDIEDFLEEMEYKPDVLNIDWSDRRIIRELLEYLNSYGLIFRILEEMRSLGIKEFKEDYCE